ncbi:WxL domain-containing protein [Agrilactobacillus fermenti]|uniref:WxL domain-containing protein n=1 Tax=Agrilactobacillus fermenti TaxID=2586909 RepID=UPI003A5BD1EB
MRKWEKLLLVSVGVIGALSTAAETKKVVRADGTTATTSASVEFIGGLSLVQVPNFDFGFNAPDYDTSHGFQLLDEASDSTDSDGMGRSLVVRNDGGMNKWQVTASYSTFTNKLADSSNTLPADTYMKWSIDKDQMQKIKTDNSNDTWESTDIISDDTSSGIIRQGETKQVFSSVGSKGAEAGTYRISFNPKTSAEFYIGPNYQKKGQFVAPVTWTLSASPTTNK